MHMFRARDHVRGAWEQLSDHPFFALPGGMGAAKISVIIPAYGRHRLVRRAVASALAQTYPVHEVIVVDDGSTPAITPAGLALSDQRIKLVRLETNGGAAAARNVGIAQASGDLIALLDSDDYWFEDKLAMQLRCLERQGEPTELMAVVCGWNVVKSGDNPHCSRLPIGSADIADFVSGCWFSPGSTLLIARSAFDRVGPFDPRLRRLEDLEWFIRFAQLGGRLVSAPGVGVGISHGQRARFTDVAAAADAILARFASNGSNAIKASDRRRLQAWLHVEKAAAARNEGAWPAMARHLALSMALVPRSSVKLKQWWSIARPRNVAAGMPHFLETVHDA